MQEFVYFVDKNDNPTGEIAEKIQAHSNDTRLHAAFSCYIFDNKGNLLVTKRSDRKKVWPGLWTNSCCGHPMPNESRVDAIVRRVAVELGAKVKDIKLLVPEYMYKTPAHEGIIEHEFCPIYSAIIDSDIALNPNEVSDYKWISWQDFLDEITKDSNNYSDPESADTAKWSWWCKDQQRFIKSKPI